MDELDHVTHTGVGSVVVLASRSSCSPVDWRISCSYSDLDTQPTSTSTTTSLTSTRHDHALDEHDTTTGEHDDDAAPPHVDNADAGYRRREFAGDC